MADISARMRLKIGIFGRRNVGKSSVFNGLARYEAAIVSPEKGTTTDPVQKAMEHHFLGPLMLIDTAGLDDEGLLGEKRVIRSLQMSEKVDVGLLLINAGSWGEEEISLANWFRDKNVPLVIVMNKIDSNPPDEKDVKLLEDSGFPWVKISALTGEGMEDLYKQISYILPNYWLESRPIIRDIYPEGGNALLAVEPAYELPAGRIYNPHNRIIRDALDHNALCSVVKGNRLKPFIERLSSLPDLVIADTEVIDDTLELFAGDTPVMSTSIIMSRHRGDLIDFAANAAVLAKLKKGAKVIMADLTVSLFKDSTSSLVETAEYINNLPGREYSFTFVGRREFPDESERPENLELIIVKGEESLTIKKTLDKVNGARNAGIPLTNLDFVNALYKPSHKKLLDPFKSKYPRLREAVREI